MNDEIETFPQVVHSITDFQLRNLKKQFAAAERAAIVVFVRSQDKSAHPQDIADAISRGDHLKPKDKG